ncbi:MAG: choline dehydrogenase [Alphaproteobacteria bacterium]|nr:MAG: choline dehydrogenase [Caulobacteraceae bacterium]TPW04332.1 MAG: choline dehydrogenase [Alphaproteobacteria bacterium]
MAEAGSVTRADYVIVGAGSAGCVLAARLSEDGAARVALLEAGPKDSSLLVRMPAGAGRLIPTKNPQNWGFWTEPQAHCDNRRMFWPRGKGWGGSSSINGMIYIRGHARDYDQWRQMGLAGWGYRDVLPYFRRAETFEAGADPWHGGEGPLHVSRPSSHNPLYKAFVQAGAAAGHPVTRDFNGHQQEGFGPYQLTIKDGERWSASFAYLRPAIGRPNLTVISQAYATRILIEKGRAVGVEYAGGPGKPAQRIYADKEVLLAAGAVQSPQLLQLSGVGDPALLAKFGIAVNAPLSEVGRNLQDHLDVCIINECTKPITAYSAQAGINQIKTGLNYMFRKQGPGRQNFLESGAFLKTRPELDRPDAQLHLVAAIMIDHGNTQMKQDGFTIHACQLRPESLGTIMLKSADPFAEPAIDPNYLAADLDRRTMRDLVKLSRDVASQKPLDFLRGAEIRPGKDVKTDAEIDAWIRQTSETIYHPVGACRMGADERAVVDETLRVRGVEGLRVVDASVMPTLVGGNTNAPTIMIAEKAADMILGRKAMAPEDALIAEDGERAA